MNENIFNTLVAIKKLSFKINETQNKYHILKIGGKQNFNIFEGIITPQKLHHEKYHSNFIKYLLDPRGNHDCGAYFLEKFFDEVKKEIEDKRLNYHIPPKSEYRKSKTYRERPANGRFIDITIEYKKDWIIFIENKLRHTEGQEQIKDYYAFIKIFTKSECNIPIFLTLDGRLPQSIDTVEQEKIICLSYQDHIIRWLENCCFDKELISYPHITNVLLQYISIIKKELNIMENKETEEVMEYLNQHKGDAALIFKEQVKIYDVINNFADNERRKFFSLLLDLLIPGFIDIGINITGQKKSDNNPSFILQCQYKETTFDFLLWFSNLDQKWGAGWQIFIGNSPFYFAIDSLNYGNDDTGYSGYGISINGINDHENISSGTIEILRILEEKKELEAVTEIKNIIISKIKNNFMPSLHYTLENK